MRERRPTEAEAIERIRAAGRRMVASGAGKNPDAAAPPVTATPAPPAGAAPPPPAFTEHEREPGGDDDA